MDARDLNRLYLALPIDPKAGTTVAQLAHRLGWPKDGRKVREGIRDLRRGSKGREPVPIVADSKANSIYIDATDDLAAFIECRDGLHGRAMDLLGTVQDMDFVIADRSYRDGHLFPVDQLAS